MADVSINRVEAHKQHAGASDAGGWIVSPIFDLLFFANVLWLLAFLPAYLSPEGEPYIEFWQVYFIATPHRWITHFLVVTDPDRRAGRNGLFVAIAVGLAVIIGGVQLGTGSLAALGLSYHVWNGWHFGAQHSGILRIYALKSGVGRRWLDTYAVRLFVVYAAIRLIPGFDRGVEFFRLDVAWLDYAVLAVPVGMLCSELVSMSRDRLPKLSYLTSVCALYSSLILAAHFQQPKLILSLVTAATIFHSFEYFAIVGHYANRRQDHGSQGIFQLVARHWILTLFWFIIAFGIVSSTAHHLIAEIWYGVNLWASFLHFAYDGLIWKLRRPATAEVLEATKVGA